MHAIGKFEPSAVSLLDLCKLVDPASHRARLMHQSRLVRCRYIVRELNQVLKARRAGGLAERPWRSACVPRTSRRCCTGRSMK